MYIYIYIKCTSDLMCMWIRLGVRWQCIGGEDVWIGGRIGQRWKENSPWVFLKLGDRTTMKDRWWGEFGVTGVGRNRRLLRSGGSAFRTLTDRHLVCWSAFGSLCDRHLGRSLSLSLSAFGSLRSFFLWLSLSFARVRKMFEGKMIL